MIKVNLDLIMVKRGISSKDLAKAIGITPANLSILKTGKAKGIRFATLEKICEVLHCQPADILEYVGEEISVEGVPEMETQRQQLLDLIDIAYQNVKDPKFTNFRTLLVQFATSLNNDDDDFIKIMLGLRTELLQADLSLNLKNRISGLPKEYSDIFYFIEPQLKKVDSKVMDRYTRYGFVPMKFGSTIKYP